MKTREKYERLLEKVISPKACDVGRSTIYSFPKFCKHCNQGMKKPAQWERRAIKALFKRGYCSVECLNIGPQHQSTFIKRVKEQKPYKRDPLIEEMAFTALEVMREEQELNPVLRNVLHADRTFKYLSEKLAYMVDATGDRWYPSKFYYWLDMGSRR